MVRAMIKRHLALAEQHVALGSQHIETQHEVIANLRLLGHPTGQAEDILAIFETLQKQHVADRDRLREALTALPP
jgi:hypothetical protein